MKSINPKILKLDQTVVTILKWLSYISAVSVILTMLIAFIDVIAAKVFNSSVKYGTEIITYLNITTVFLPLAYVELTTGHVVIEVVTNKLKKVVFNILRVFMCLLGSVTCFFIAYRQAIVTVNKFDIIARMSSTGGPLIWPFAAILTFGFLLMGLCFLWDLVRLGAGIDNKMYDNKGKLKEIELGSEGKEE